MSAILQNIFYSKFRNLPASVRSSISLKQIQDVYKYMVDPCVEQAISMYMGAPTDSVKSDTYDKVIAGIVVKDTEKRRNPVALYRAGSGLELVVQSSVDKYKRYKLENNQNYIGTYTNGVTAQQIIDDWR